MSNYTGIVEHYEEKFREHGDNHRGVDWPDKEELNTRFKVMTDMMKGSLKNQSVRVLDFGCGNGLLLDYLNENGLMKSIDYTGLDLGSSFITHCRNKYVNHEFLHLDVLENPELLPNFDYVFMNGVFTEKLELSHADMCQYLENVVSTVFQKTEIGLAFNVMSKHVDWEREDLFHLSFDQLSEILVDKITRNHVFRGDYGLYEYTTYLYKYPNS